MMTGKPDHLPVIGMLAACLIWLKQEGMILAPCAILPSFRRVFREGSWKNLCVLVLPALLLAGYWHIFLRNAGVQRGLDFIDVTPTTLSTHVTRIPYIAAWMGREVLNWKAWGILWPMFFLALILPNSGTSGSTRLFVAFVTLAPLVVYMGTYVFSSWNPFINHVKY